MVINGYRRPLVQEDMWDLNEKDSTGYVSQKFEDIMKEELRKARQRLQKKQSKKKKSSPKSDRDQNGLAKGVSHDVLVMVKELSRMPLHLCYQEFRSGLKPIKPR